jgi:PPP family 3-phenylpropionic acid transporter
MNLIFNLLFFLYFSCLGIYGPYLAVYLADKNFSGVQIGFLLGSLPIAILIASPIWSYFSDVLNKRKILLVVGCLGAGLSTYALGRADQYSLNFLWIILMAIMSAPILPIGTAIVLDALESQGNREKFSLVRLWGSLGFAITSLIWGTFFLEEITRYLPWGLAGLFFLLGAISLLLPEKATDFTYSGLGGLKILTQNKQFTFYLLGSVFIGASISAYNNYQTIFFQSLDASALLIGIIVSIQAFVEIPTMLWMPFLFKHLSMRVMIMIGAFALILRWALYLITQQGIYALPIQLLNGLGIPAFFVVGVAYVDRIVSSKWRATAQGLYNAALLGIGSGIGVYLAGMVYEWFNVRSIWVLNIIFGLIGMVLLGLAFWGPKTGE